VKVRDAIEILSQFDPDVEIAAIDDFHVDTTKPGPANIVWHWREPFIEWDEHEGKVTVG
jgi:hypothetical protein